MCVDSNLNSLLLVRKRGRRGGTKQHYRPSNTVINNGSNTHRIVTGKEETHCMYQPANWEPADENAEGRGGGGGCWGQNRRCDKKPNNNLSNVHAWTSQKNTSDIEQCITSTPNHYHTDEAVFFLIAQFPVPANCACCPFRKWTGFISTIPNSEGEI